VRTELWIAFLYLYSVGIPLGLLIALPFFLGPDWPYFLATAILVQGIGLVVLILRFGAHAAFRTRSRLIQELVDEEEATEPAGEVNKRPNEQTAKEVVAAANSPDGTRRDAPPPPRTVA